MPGGQRILSEQTDPAPTGAAPLDEATPRIRAALAGYHRAYGDLMDAAKHTHESGGKDPDHNLAVAPFGLVRAASGLANAVEAALPRLLAAEAVVVAAPVDDATLAKLEQAAAVLAMHEGEYVVSIADEIGTELAKARGRYGMIHSAHEGIAVIREEYLEAEREVFRRVLDAGALRKELIQLATMCVRLIEDLGLVDPDALVPM